jgi:geranylgeranyl diphosphate synthase type II
MDLKRELAARRQDVDACLERLLPVEDGPASRVVRAMRYAVLGGGKRLRPILALACCEACGGSGDDVLEPACALELIHTYSLVHDDLPAMDDDDLRRGRATLHVEYDEATAILAGDGLLTLAFEVLGARPERAGAARRVDAVITVARAAGVAGMVGGQVGDLEAERTEVDVRRLEWIHRHKTGGLLQASAELGAIHAGADDEARRALRGYGAALGLAFQITDDVLDCTASSAELGKTAGKDERSGKATYPALFGLERSRELARETIDAALGALVPAGARTPLLESLARYAVERTH